MAWHHGDKTGAVRAFKGLLGLPAGQRAHRTLRATFVLGRAAEAGGDREDALARHAEVRSLVDGGTPGPLGLAVTTFGRRPPRGARR
jgi:hypothetical protein